MKIFALLIFPFIHHVEKLCVQFLWRYIGVVNKQRNNKINLLGVQISMFILQILCTLWNSQLCKNRIK